MRKNYNSLKSNLNSKHELNILASATKLNPLLRASKNVFTWASFLGLRLPVGGLICLVDWLDTGCCISHLFFIHVDLSGFVSSELGQRYGVLVQLDEGRRALPRPRPCV